MFCCAVLCVISSFVIVLMGKRESVAFLPPSSCRLVTLIVLWLFLTMPQAGLQWLVEVLPDHTHLPFWVL